MDNIQPLPEREIGEVITREDLLEKFEVWLNMQGMSELTRDTYTLRLSKFFDWLGSRSWANVTPVDVVTWRDELIKEYSPQSVALHLTAARRFYSMLVSGGVLPANPFAEVKAPKRKNSTQRKRDTITKQEWRKLADTCDDTPAGRRDLAILTLAYELGFREIEIQRVNLEDIRTMGEVRVVWVQSKGDTSPGDWLVIPPHVEDVLNDWFAVRGDDSGPLFISLSNRSHGTRLSLSAIRTIWNSRKDQAGIVGKGKTFHSLRHTAIDSRARYAVRHGKSPFLVQTFARHKSLDTTMQYIHDVGRMDDPPELWGTHTNGNGENNNNT